MNVPKKVIVHCADTPDLATTDPKFDEFGLSQIDEWHKARGFNKVGYHYIIRKTGVVEKGREDSEQGAHCEANHGNHDSVGICFVGRSSFNDDQYNSFFDLFHKLKKEHGITPDHYFGHYEFEPLKTCPNIEMVSLRKRLSDLKGDSPWTLLKHFICQKLSGFKS